MTKRSTFQTSGRARKQHKGSLRQSTEDQSALDEQLETNVQKESHLTRLPSLPSRVAAAIAAEILEGRLAQGARLPTEFEYSKKFGVSRTVVREAISQLRSDGMVKSRQGVGAFVQGGPKSPTLRIDANLLSDRLVFANILELRAVLEIRASALAAHRASTQQLQAISEAMDRMRRARNWLSEGVPADLDFHRAIAIASDNQHMSAVVAFLCEQMKESIMFMRHNHSYIGKEAVETNISEHAAIYDAILARDPILAARTMRSHLINAARRLGYELRDEALL